jgi:hypothetical protein
LLFILTPDKLSIKLNKSACNHLFSGFLVCFFKIKSTLYRTEAMSNCTIYVKEVQMPMFPIKVTNSLAKTIYTPQKDDLMPGAMYPRVIQLQHGENGNGDLLVTFEQYKNGDAPLFPIYRSTDQGVTWHLFSEIRDTVNGWGLRYQPHLYELPEAIGGLLRGTILAAGNSIPKDMSKTKIDLYKSEDRGLTWEYLSTVVVGGEAAIYKDPVWEPFLITDSKGNLICYYSDERKKPEGYNQLLAHRVSRNGIDWGEEDYDVAISDQVSRPGMVVVSQLPNGQYMMTYEIVGAPDMPNWPVYYKISEDGINWGDSSDLGRRIATPDGLFLGSMPYHIWIPIGGPKGMILASAKGYRDDGSTISTSVFLANYDLGEGEWHKIQTSLSHDDSLWFTGWSRGMAHLVGSNQIIHLSPVQINSHQAEIKCAFIKIEL